MFHSLSRRCLIFTLVIAPFAAWFACSSPSDDRAAPASAPKASPAGAPPESAPSDPPAPASEPSAGAPDPTLAVPVAPVGVTATRVDCMANGAPAWCKKLRYATPSEKKGTVVALLRAEGPGEFYWCERGRFVSEVARHGTDLDKAETGADVLTLEPRTTDGATTYRYFFVPEGSTAPLPNWMGPCPM